MIGRQALFRRSNRRSAIVLFGLLVLLVVIASAVVVRIYTQLDLAANLEHRVVTTELELSDVLRVELDEEAGLRGYEGTGQQFFLDSYTTAQSQFGDTLSTLEYSARSLGHDDLQRTIADIGTAHKSWEDDAAAPLIANPHAKTAAVSRTLGKILIDQIRSDIDHSKQLLDREIARSQLELRRTIDQSLFGGLATVTIFGVIGIIFVSSRNQMLAKIDRSRSIVDVLQGAFRTDLDRIRGITFGTAYLSATADAAVGGDLYDVRRMDDASGLVLVADVSGKGVEAAVNTAFVKYSIRTLAHSERSPAKILAAFNALFLETIKNPNLFVVTFVGVIDAERGLLTYASAGHSGAYLRHEGRVSQLEVTGTVVGLDASFPYEERTIALCAGDVVLLATDGLTEARDADGHVLDDAGAMALLARAPAEPQACALYLADAVKSRSGNKPADDLAIVTIGVDERTV